MQFGVCASPAQLEKISAAGAKYIECAVTGLMSLSDGQLTAFRDELAAIHIRCQALCVLFPGREIPLTGEDADLDAADTYVRRVFERLCPLLEPLVVVFGSGGARSVPDGYNRDKAFAQLIEAGGVIARAAEPYGLTIALEPLNRRESNLVNTLAEALEVVQRVDHPNFRLLADLYHMLTEEEPPESLYACEGMLAHTHIAVRESRICPRPQDAKVFKPYFKALQEIRYGARMSVEADLGDMSGLSAAFALMQEWAQM